MGKRKLTQRPKPLRAWMAVGAYGMPAFDKNDLLFVYLHKPHCNAVPVLITVDSAASRLSRRKP